MMWAWWRRPEPEHSEAAAVVGEERPGRVLVPVHLNDDGEPDQWVWCAPESAADWDVTRWK